MNTYPENRVTSEKQILLTLYHGGVLWEVPHTDYCRLESPAGHLVGLVPQSLAMRLAKTQRLARGLGRSGISYLLTRSGTIESRIAQTKTAPKGG